ncbi:MAG: RAMP superfamily CRISPR-associated protein [Archaeoglobaceae archaeon]
MSFGSYSLLATVSGKIRAVGPMRIGAGRALSIVTSDLPVIKNSRNEPVIPGSSLKGFFRGHLRRILLMKMDTKKADDILKEVFGGTEEEDNASAILFHEVPMKEGRLAERKHIAINPKTCGVQNLFDVECVLDGAIFEGKILSARNLNPRALGLLKPVMDLANFGVARLGGFKSRGYGEISIEVNEISLIFPGKSLEDLNAGFEVKNLIPRGFPSIKVKKSDGSVSVDGFALNPEIRENATFFGIEMKFRGSEALKFLDSMLKLVKL